VTLLHIFVIAIVQGLTEFLPISSSGHLVLVPAVTGWPDQGLAIDVAVHVGTLGAVMLFFWRDVTAMAAGLLRLLSGQNSPGAELVARLVVATIPVVVAGYVVHRYAGDVLRSPEIIAWTTLIFGIVLYLADRTGLTVRSIAHLTYGHALIAGLLQTLALIPGTSRSGITMTAARLLGYERRDAARLSMLMSIPVIVAAGTLSGLELYETGDPVLTEAAMIASGLSFVTAVLAIAAMMAMLRYLTFTPFIVYRVFILGGALFYWVYVMDAQPLTEIFAETALAAGRVAP